MHPIRQIGWILMDKVSHETIIDQLMDCLKPFQA